MPKRSILHVHRILLEMIQQNFARTHPIQLPSPTKTGRGGKKQATPAVPHQDRGCLVWEVRHAGLLGIKYEVAVRKDLFQSIKKDEGDGESVEMDAEDEGKSILQGVVDSAVQGYDHILALLRSTVSCTFQVGGQG